MTATRTVVPTSYWHRLGDGRLQCDVCPRACKLRDGQEGLCFVRERAGDELVLTTYGRSSGFCIDPIEKKPLHHFHPGTPVLSFGTAGCNLACRYCQNWDISKSREVATLSDEATPATIAESAEILGCPTVAFTYNDPVVFLEYAVDVARACHERGIRTVAVTAGYIEPAPRRELFAEIDAVNVDLKAFSEDFYGRMCGGHLRPVLDTIEYLVHDTPAWVELTTLLILGRNDNDREVDALTQWIASRLGPDIPLHLTAFHPAFKLLDVPSTPHASLRRARAIALENGLRYVYVGNVRDDEGSTTWCPRCGIALIERDGYMIRAYRLDAEGACTACGTPCPGRFDPTPGDWGDRRVPVRLRDA